MKRFLPLLFVCVFFVIKINTAIAQDSKIDSLTHALLNASNEKEIGRLNIKLGREFISSDTLLAKEYFKKGLIIANNKNDDLGKGMYHLYSAYLICNKGLYRDGLIAFNLASDNLNDFISNNNITENEKRETESLLIDAELSRGNIFLELYEYEKAVDMFWKVLKLLETINFPEKNVAFVTTYHSIAMAYYHRSEFITALEYYLKSLPYAEKDGNQELIAETNIYIASCNTVLKKYDLALKYLQKAEPIAIKSRNVTLKLQFYARKGELYNFTEKWNDAIENYDKSIQNASIIGNIYMEATFTNAKSVCLLKLGRLDEAKKVALKALSLAKSINKKREILEVQRNLSKIEAASGNFNYAYEYLEQFNEGDDSLHSAEITEKIQALDKKYQSELKDEKIQKLELDKKIQKLNLDRKNTINFVLIGAALGLLLIILLSYRGYKNKQKLHQQRISELEKEKQLTATEAVLKGEEQERTRLAKDLHDGLGGMLSGIKYSFQTMKGNLIMTPENQQAFERSMDMLDSSIKEMRRVAHNMMPESLVRFGLDTALNDYCKSVNKSGALKVNYLSIGLVNHNFEQTIAIAIYRIIQELISNTLKHAAAKNAVVQVTKSDNLLAITVEDDGKGFDTNILDQSKGIGWINIKHRVDFLKGKIDINSTAGSGTSVHIEFEI